MLKPLAFWLTAAAGVNPAWAEDAPYPLTFEAYSYAQIACDMLKDKACKAMLAARKPFWNIVDTKDPISDERSVLMMRPDETAIAENKMKPALSLGCSKNKVFAAVSFEGYWRAPTVSVTVRVDDQPPTDQTWTNYQGFLAISGPLFIRSVWTAKKVAVRAIDDSGAVHTLVFRVDDLSREGVWLTDACPNQRLPLPDRTPKTP